MKVMIGTMVKNSAMFLPSYFNLLRSLTYPKNNIRIVFIYGNSSDRTLEIIKEEEAKGDLDICIYSEQNDQNLRVGGAQLAASAYNDFQNAMKEDEDYFLLLDSDIKGAPSNLIEELIAVNADIVAPYPWSEEHRHFYDNWIFRINNIRFSPTHPPGEGLKYPIIVDSVGTCFLAKSHVFKGVQIVNPYPNLQFCNKAREMNYMVIACPYLEIIHIDIEKLDPPIIHNPLPQEYGFYPKNGFLDSSNYQPRRFIPISKELIKEQEKDFMNNIMRGECK